MYHRLLNIFSIIVITASLLPVQAREAQQEQSIHAINQENLTKNVTKSQTSPKNQPLDKEIVDDFHWMEQFHDSISDSVYQSAVWFDNFFIEDNDEISTPKTNARIRLGWKPKARDWSDIETRFRIKVKLPYFKNKMDLILSDDDETNQGHLPLESVNTQRDNDEEHFAAAVRFTHKQEKNRLLESRIGISGGDIFIKARHRSRHSWDNSHSIRIEPSLYYFIDDGLGAKLLLEYDYQIAKKTQFRINYSIRGSESFSGIRWKHGFYRLNQLSDKTASITGLQIEGERSGEQGFIVNKYTLSYRYRFNALRKWLYFEVEPFIEWPEDQHYSTTPGIALRVEGYFYKG